MPPDGTKASLLGRSARLYAYGQLRGTIAKGEATR